VPHRRVVKSFADRGFPSDRGRQTGDRSCSVCIEGTSFGRLFLIRIDLARDANGNNILRGVNVDVNLLVPALAVTTQAKILGATYGFQIVPPFLDQRLALARADVQTSTSYGFGDMYVQPVNLGWRTKRADYLAAYGFYAPAGAGDRSLNMWAHEIVAGATVYFDYQKKWNVALTGFYDIHQSKSNQDIRVGNILTIEGGAARSFLKGAAHGGVAYVAQWKMTRDSDIPSRLPRTNGRVFGLGPDVAVPVFAKGTLLGLIGFRYSWEFGAKTNFEGHNLVISFTLAKLNLPH
jgi:hypothetical protein